MQGLRCVIKKRGTPGLIASRNTCTQSNETFPFYNFNNMSFHVILQCFFSLLVCRSYLSMFSIITVESRNLGVRSRIDAYKPVQVRNEKEHELTSCVNSTSRTNIQSSPFYLSSPSWNDSGLLSELSRRETIVIRPVISRTE